MPDSTHKFGRNRLRLLVLIFFVQLSTLNGFVIGAEDMDSVLVFGTSNYRTNPEEVLRRCGKASKHFKEVGNKHKQAQCMNIMGLSYWSMAEKDSALLSFYSAESLAIQIDSLSLVAAIRSNLARFYSGQSQFDSAVFYYQQVLDFNQRVGDYVNKARTLASMGKVYIYLNELDQALRLEQQALDLLDGTEEYKSLGQIFNTIGYVYDELGFYDSAIHYYARSVENREYAKDELGALYTQTNLCVAYRNLEQDENAYTCNLRALEMSRTLGIQEVEAVNLLNLGINLSDLGNYHQSNIYLDSAAVLLNSLEDIRNLRELEGMYWFNLEKLGAYKDALEHYKQYKFWADSLLNIDKYQAVEELNTRYETEKKDARNALLTEQSKLQQMEIQQKNKILIGIAVVSVLSLGLLILGFNRYKLKKQAEVSERELQMQTELRKSELSSRESERKRIARELHDGVGQQLTAISMRYSVLNGDSKDPELEQLIQQTAVDVRDISHRMMPRALADNDLSGAIQDLVDKSGNAEVVCTFEKAGEVSGFSEEGLVNVYRIAQEAINNALKHSGCTEIHVGLFKLANSNMLTVEDNGVGFNHEESNGLGLDNMQLRTEAIGGTLDIISGSGTVCTLKW